MVLQRKQKRIEPEQYLAMERAAETKSEFSDGEVFAMSGASRRHNTITGNAFASLHAQLRGRRCNIFQSDMRVKVAASGLHTYPDIAIVCGGARFEDAETDTLLNPQVIIEVLSKSTAAYDRGEKFEHYRKLPSLVEYLLVAQERCLVEHYIRQPDGNWLFSEASSLQDVIDLPSVGCTLALADVYEDVLAIMQ